MAAADTTRSHAADRTATGLLARVRARDPAAWQRLVGLCGPLVYRWCLRAGLAPAAAADVGQEVFADLARAVGSFPDPGAAGGFLVWLHGLTRAALRRRQPEAGPQPGAPEGGPDEADAALLLGRAFELVCGEFDGPSCAAFRRVVLDGEPPGDVAATLGLPVHAVYVARAQILRRLREELAAVLDVGRLGPPAEGPGDGAEGDDAR